MGLANEVDARSRNALFRAQYAEVLRRAGDNMAAVTRKIATDLQTKLVLRSPVDTGRFRGNWNCGIGGMTRLTTSENDPSGESSIQRAIEALQGWKAGQTIYLTNSLPYARRLEYGWSKQAPQGMLRLTLLEFRSVIESAVSEVKGKP